MAAAADSRLTWKDLAENPHLRAGISKRTLFKSAFERSKSGDPSAQRVFCLLLKEDPFLLSGKSFLSSTDDGCAWRLEEMPLQVLNNEFAEVLQKRASLVVFQLIDFADIISNPEVRERHVIAHSTNGTDEYDPAFLKRWDALPFEKLEGIFPDASNLYCTVIEDIKNTTMRLLRKCYSTEPSVPSDASSGVALTFARAAEGATSVATPTPGSDL